MNKNTPLSSVSNDRAIAGEVNWKEIRKNLSAIPCLYTREIVFLAHSDRTMQNCLKLLESKNLAARTFNNFNAALRIGIAKTADINVIADEFAAASNTNFTKLLRLRASQDLQVITWNNSSIDELVLSIQNSISSINRMETKKLVIEKIVESRASSNRLKHGELIQNKLPISENDFRNLLHKKLDDNLKDEPEMILAKAISVIKELK